jgi:hypothetical protein
MNPVTISWTMNTSPNFPLPSFLPNLKSLNFTYLFEDLSLKLPDERSDILGLFFNLLKLEF